MRKQDENKKIAIFQATKELLNEIGFADTSMSKIAKRAGVSAATIYVYFENKDDLLRQLYLNVKKKMVETVAGSIVGYTASVRDSIKKSMRAYMDYLLQYQEDFLFLEQFSNSPLIQNLCIQETMPETKFLQDIVERGKAEGVIRQVEFQYLFMYCVFPIDEIVKKSYATKQMISENEFDLIFNMTWDAISI